jgi:hypothetical protein
VLDALASGLTKIEKHDGMVPLDSCAAGIRSFKNGKKKHSFQENQPTYRLYAPRVNHGDLMAVFPDTQPDSDCSDPSHLGADCNMQPVQWYKNMITRGWNDLKLFDSYRPKSNYLVDR